MGDYAFSYCAKINNIVVPESVEKIGDNTFYGCNALTSLILPEKLTEEDTNKEIEEDRYRINRRNTLFSM